MKYPVISKIKKISSIVFAYVLILGLTGIVHAQSQNLKGEYTQKSVITEKKSANKHSPKKEAKVIKKKQSNRGKDTGNYKGAQPPQGGRLGQGPE